MSEHPNNAGAPYHGWPRDRLSVSFRALISATCLLFAVGGIAYLLWDFDVIPKRVVKSGSITVTIAGQPRQTVGARTRSIIVPSGRHTTKSWQVQLPDGQWIDCKSDCASAYRSRL